MDGITAEPLTSCRYPANPVNPALLLVVVVVVVVVPLHGGSSSDITAALRCGGWDDDDLRGAAEIYRSGRDRSSSMDTRSSRSDRN